MSHIPNVITRDDDQNSVSSEFTWTAQPPEDAPRHVLSTILGEIDVLQSKPDIVMSLELALAEIVNNIFEHAFCEQSNCQVLVRTHQSQDALLIRIVDNGHALPNDAMPEGTAPDVFVAQEELPEGGFGWFLIKSLVDDLSYQRTDGTNHLAFHIPFEPSDTPT